MAAVLGAPAPAGATPRWWLWLLPPTAAGVALRLVNLHGQILGGDEQHAVREALELPVSRLLVTYQDTDFCQPLAAGYRLLLDSGVRLSEFELRLPVLLASIAAIVVLPLLLRHRLGPAAATVLAWLLALSPLLVLYGRMVRSYGLVVLVAAAAVASFDAWLAGRGRRYGAAWAVLAPAATYLHLLAAPMVAAPFVLAAGEYLVRRRPPPAWRELLAWGGLALAGVLAFVVPSWPSLSILIGSKEGASHPGLAVLPALLRLQAGSPAIDGSPHLLLVAVFWLLAATGLGLLLRRQPGFGLYTLGVAALHIGAVLVLAPLGIDQPLILNRYLLCLTPLLLAWVAAGLAHPWPWLPAAARPVLAGVVLLALFLGGPLVDAERWRSSFVHHSDWLSFDQPLPALPPSAVPAVYHQIAADTAPGAVLEAPMSIVWRWSRTPYLYQLVHRRPVLGVVGDPAFLLDPRLDLQNLLPAEPDALLASRARYLVVHQDLLAEEAAVPASRWLRARLRRGQEIPGPWAELRSEAQTLTRRLRRQWGPPDVADERIRMWDLDRVRAQVPAGRPKESGRSGQNGT